MCELLEAGTQNLELAFDKTKKRPSAIPSLPDGPHVLTFSPVVEDKPTLGYGV